MITDVVILMRHGKERWVPMTLAEFVDILLDYSPSYIEGESQHISHHLENLKKFILWTWNNPSPYSIDDIVRLVNHIDSNFKTSSSKFKLNGQDLDLL